MNVESEKRKGAYMAYTYIMVTSHKADSTYCGNWLVIASDPVEALKKFLWVYPEHKDNKITVEPFDPNKDEVARGMYKACVACECIF